MNRCNDDDNDGDGDDDGDVPCRVRMTDDRIRDGERRARRPGHRTRWPGHCAGTEATPQPRSPGTPSSPFSPAVPLPFCLSRSLSPCFSLSLCNTLPPPPRIVLPSSRRYSLFLLRGHAMVGKFGEPSWRVCIKLSFPLFISLPSCNVSTRLFRRIQMNCTPVAFENLSSISFRRTATLPPPPREFLFLCCTRFPPSSTISNLLAFLSISPFIYPFGISSLLFSCAQPSLLSVPFLFAFLVFLLSPFLKLFLVSSTFSSLSVSFSRSPTRNT